mgnify:CR=1 FL=1
MLAIASSSFSRQKGRFSVVKKMIELGISINTSGKLMIKDVKIQDSSLANAVGVDRRVVRETVIQLLEDPVLNNIFCNTKPVGTSLVEIATLLGYSVLLISGNSFNTGASFTGLTVNVKPSLSVSSPSLTVAVKLSLPLKLAGALNITSLPDKLAMISVPVVIL